MLKHINKNKCLHLETFVPSLQVAQIRKARQTENEHKIKLGKQKTKESWMVQLAADMDVRTIVKPFSAQTPAHEVFIESTLPT